MSQYIPGYQLIKDAVAGDKSSEKRVTFIGTRGSGKTTGLGCLALACGKRSEIDGNFKYAIFERNSGLREIPSLLQRGRFPPATLPGSVYEADIIMEWKSTFGTKKIRLPFCETAGEDVQKIIGRFSQDVYRTAPDWRSASLLEKYIDMSNGFVIVIPVPRALMFVDKGYQLEPDDLSKDPDVNIARIVQAIIQCKEDSHSPRIEGMAVLLTQYDIIAFHTKHMGMDLYSVQGIQRFLNKYFPQTMGLLKFFDLTKVRFFPVHVQVVRDANNPHEFAQWPDGTGDRIQIDDQRRLPVYSEESYLNLIEWIKQTFAG